MYTSKSSTDKINVMASKFAIVVSKSGEKVEYVKPTQKTIQPQSTRARLTRIRNMRQPRESPRTTWEDRANR